MRKTVALILLVFICFTGCKKESEKTENEKEKTTSIQTKKLKLKLEPKSDSKVSGNIVFTQENDEVTMVAVLEGLTPGSHAIHLHEKADCSSSDGKSTGGHWNPTAQPHGKWGASSGYHKGDIGNFEADSNGNGTITFSTDQWCMGCGDDTKDIMGKAIIVHEGKDDFNTQPTGAAGGRVSCGAILE